MNSSSTLHVNRARPSLMMRLTRAVEPIALPIAGSRWFPLWAILHHTGRTSGTQYATPIVALPTPHGFVIPVPFGDATQWVRNLLAAGGGSLRVGGHTRRFEEPRIVEGDAGDRYLPLPFRFMARRLGIRRFVLVKRLPD
jgi:deazaflavin-dependent oxidoreductase (nitroreductase family)